MELNIRFDCKYLRNILLVFVIFTLIYPVVWIFFPLALVRIIQILGVICFVKYIYKCDFKLNKNFFRVIFLFFLLLFISFIPCFYNNSDFSFTVFVSNSIWYIWGAFFVFTIFDISTLSFTKLCELILLAAFFQALISFAMFLSPFLYDFVMSFIVLSDGANVRSSLVEYRLMGIGNSLWSAGVNYSVDILLLSALPFLPDSKIYKNRFFYWILVITILIAGILSARTFFISIILLLLYLFIMAKSKIRMFLQIFKTMVIFLGILTFLFFFVFKDVYDERVDKIIMWAFELFINLFEGNGIVTSSSDIMSDMYIFPTNISTWLLGDGFYTLRDGSYYMGTDIGFIRQIYYYGVLGLLFYWYVTIVFYVSTAKFYYAKSIKSLLLILFVLQLVLTFKGIIDLSSYVSLFFVFGLLKYNHCEKSKFSLCYCSMLQSS